MKWSEAATGGVWRRKKNGSLWNIYCMSSKGSLVATVSAVPHMLASSSELSPQSSLPSQTHVWSLHKVLLQMNSSARQKNAPAVTQNTTLLLKLLSLLSERRKTTFFYLIQPICPSSFHLVVSAFALTHFVAEEINIHLLNDKSAFSSQLFLRWGWKVRNIFF